MMEAERKRVGRAAGQDSSNRRSFVGKSLPAGVGPRRTPDQGGKPRQIPWKLGKTGARRITGSQKA